MTTDAASSTPDAGVHDLTPTEPPVLVGPVLVVGTGLIGASIGKALVAADCEVHLWDLDHANALLAAGRGAGWLEEMDDEAYRTVVVATPPSVTAATVVERLRRHPNAIITDTASVKGTIAHQVEELGRAAGIDVSRYVGSHPMAGTQYTGPLTAASELFVDRTWVVTPRADNRHEDVARVVGLARACGARVVSMDPDEHDSAVAAVSHLPHLMSILTAANLRRARPDHLRLAGTGIRDVTRVARSQTGMWRQILTANRQAVRVQLESVSDDLDQLLARLDDPDRLEEFLAIGQTGARRIAGKHGRGMVETVPVVVEIPDAPGALARLFADVEAAGVNVEDLSVEHDVSREVGFLSIDVDPGRADELSETMRRHGWGVRS